MALSIDDRWDIVNKTWEDGNFCGDCIYFHQYHGGFYEPPSAECDVLDKCHNPNECPGVQAAIVDYEIDHKILTDDENLGDA